MEEPKTRKVDASQTTTRYMMRLETVKIIDHLKEGPIGRVVLLGPTEELAQLTGVNFAPGGNGNGYLRSAITYVRNNYGLVWQRIRGAGHIKCLGPIEIVDVTRAEQKGINRKSKRALKKLGIAAKDETDNERKIDIHRQVAQLGAIMQLSSSDTTKKLEARNLSKPPDISRLLEAFKNGT